MGMPSSVTLHVQVGDRFGSGAGTAGTTIPADRRAPPGARYDGGDPVAVLGPVRSPRSVKPASDAGTAVPSTGSARRAALAAHDQDGVGPGCARHETVTENSASVTEMSVTSGANATDCVPAGGE